MPLTPPGATTVILPALLGTGNIGLGTPQFASGVATGLSMWAAQASVTTIDVGTLGVGSGQMLFVLPQPLLLTGLTAGFASCAIIGIMAPLLIAGLSIGISGALSTQALVKTTHPTVGTGAATAKITGGSAVPMMIAGFAAVGMAGPTVVKQATAIGLGVDIAVAAFVLPVPIVGPSAPASSSGVGFGKIL